MTTMQTTEWYLHFKSGQTSVEDFENSGYPLSFTWTNGIWLTMSSGI